ncbi:hypothetical protein BS50DRAFT_373825 [Corynespora cassiicola Philippines]|uniref:Uncharacterized protein n=1 Tax=Corynespora cassiicola Philippines TaxID=1448308 RepID=A0A2T2NMY6_CORCC|nr:hypothetical protein BS50DRAFT_373825 [Corynespora cassiicola Philippines]
MSRRLTRPAHSARNAGKTRAVLGSWLLLSPGSVFSALLSAQPLSMIDLAHPPRGGGVAPLCPSWQGRHCHGQFQPRPICPTPPQCPLQCLLQGVGAGGYFPVCYDSALSDIITWLAAMSADSRLLRSQSLAGNMRRRSCGACSFAPR